MPAPLTSREEEILFALADGLTNPEIAGELSISPETVKCHIRHLLPKLGARNRTHAVALAYHRRLFVAPPA
jgi:DNA-binding NarL/FixJ family response regulator